MKESRKLNDCMMLDERWRQAAVKSQELNLSLAEAAGVHRDQLVAEVIIGVLEVEDLRAGLSWVNALSREAVEKCGSDTNMTDADRLESLARLVAHNAGRTALSQVKTARKRENLQVKMALADSWFWNRAARHVE